jgi:hypothetical protein
MSLISTVLWAEELKSSLLWNVHYKFTNCTILHTYNKKIKRLNVNILNVSVEKTQLSLDTQFL